MLILRVAVMALLSIFAARFAESRLPMPPTPLFWSVAYGDVGMAGDSLKAVMSWHNPPDTAEAGPVDSTVYNLTVSKPALYFGGKPIAANTTVLRRLKGAAVADSFKFANVARGDSVVIRVQNFRQCRKADCSAAANGGIVYKNSFAPPPSSAPKFSVTPF